MNKCATKLQSEKHCSHGLVMTEAYFHTKIYNGNKACIQWAITVTKKCIKNLNLRENMVCERHQCKDMEVEHISEIINPSDIFTKEMKENTNYHNLRNSMMVYL